MGFLEMDGIRFLSRNKYYNSLLAKGVGKIPKNSIKQV
jgi:hypothetical protein